MDRFQHWYYSPATTTAVEVKRRIKGKGQAQTSGLSGTLISEARKLLKIAAFI